MGMFAGIGVKFKAADSLMMTVLEVPDLFKVWKERRGTFLASSAAVAPTKDEILTWQTKYQKLLERAFDGVSQAQAPISATTESLPAL